MSVTRHPTLLGNMPFCNWRPGQHGSNRTTAPCVQSHTRSCASALLPCTGERHQLTQPVCLPQLSTLRHSRCTVCAQAAKVVSVAVTPASQWLVSIGIFLLCGCASIFFIAWTFVALRLRRTAQHVDKTLDAVSEHLPTIASSVNLTSLELADCILEFNHLGQEVTGGLRAGANTFKASQEQILAGGQALKKVVADVVMPGFQERAKATGEIFEHVLKSNAGLEYTEPTTAQLANATKTSIRELRQALAATTALSQVASAGASAFSQYASRQRMKEAENTTMPTPDAAGAAESADGASADVHTHAGAAAATRNAWAKLQHKQAASQTGRQASAWQRLQKRRGQGDDEMQARIRNAWGMQSHGGA